MMYHKELYAPHNDSLDRFIQSFNQTLIFPNLIMIRCPTENFKHDALIIDMDSKKILGFDWSKSPQILFIDGTWRYSQYTLIASKYDIESSDLYITTDANEEHILVLWRSDIDVSKKSYFLDHGHGGEVVRPVYKTTNYKIYNLQELETFKIAINKALNNQHNIKQKNYGGIQYE
ncbi:hypothetical protein [[Clostridium] symbiosum]|uniref:Uncharacterized protein n=1 Tax=[Clostridium] symbiosum ATCC 14940 TaxID=411472 RepID=A0ABC9U1X6_CLOSY|nr:hypothetical protein [[Clostridium] symbiosum]ERI79420.1 hypothetical protein CLOSYM_00849 [[Clostridium] symbiosum ATCC 14940]MBS6220112.1 hypothetical protein [[Clostridium] symbiosum]MDM8135536.1 hypothetical protein [[Clostridium] symbiosum]MDM8138935.1 hypothetical protein [[Clostridium] symbiosum]MDM8319837.1 hypothetical protein [[Clostridium] symbiosum]